MTPSDEERDDPPVMTPAKIRNMPGKGTPRRSVRIEDELWTAALRRAEERGESLADVIRNAVARYAAGDDSDNCQD